jgi:hypothetical protein
LLLALTCPQIGAAQPADRQRPIRVGNLNVLTIGGGYREHDHATFSEKGFVSMGYQRRILRREMRWFPLWVRTGFDFSSESTDTDSAYSVWLASDAANPNVQVIKDALVQERMSDFALRFELLADVIHLPNFALYGGGGLIIHILNYSSRGTTTKNLFERGENLIGPSLVAGGRLFMKSQPWAVYSEVRYRKVYGKLDPPPDGLPYFTGNTFDFMNVNSVSIEGGLALHW